MSDMPVEFFTNDEVAIMRMMEMCQESLDPESYEQFWTICGHLCNARRRLRDGCLERIDRYLSGQPQAEVTSGEA